jgi:ParD-like antitoxin of type II bacterial toxin-antitoxin system
MGSGIPVRLSEALTVRARSAAQVLDRSLTEQVEHWARLGQVVEAAISAGAIHRLKAHSYDPELPQRLAFAASPDGQAKAAALIRERNPDVRHGLPARAPKKRATR